MLMNGDPTLMDPKEIATFTLNYFETIFSFNPSSLQDFKLVDTIIPKLVDDTMNLITTNIPSIAKSLLLFSFLMVTVL